MCVVLGTWRELDRTEVNEVFQTMRISELQLERLEVASPLIMPPPPVKGLCPVATMVTRPAGGPRQLHVLLSADR